MSEKKEKEISRYQKIRAQRINRLIESCLSRVDEDIERLNEDKPIKVGIGTAMKNPQQVKQLAQRANVVLVDPKLNEAENDTTEVIEPTTIQEEAIQNLKTWADKLSITLSNPEDTLNKAIIFYYTEGENVVTVLVLSNGIIKVSGHIVKSFDDFKKVVEFHKAF